MLDISNVRKKIILYENDLWIVDDIKGDRVLMSKLESNAEVVEFDLYHFEALNFDFEDARFNAVEVMNQTRYYDYFLSYEKDNVVM